MSFLVLESHSYSFLNFQYTYPLFLFSFTSEAWPTSFSMQTVLDLLNEYDLLLHFFLVISDTMWQNCLNGSEKTIFHMRMKHAIPLKQGTES